MKIDAAARGPGRPRDLEKDEAIRDATWAVLSEKGYDNLTFEAVAERANVSRTTLYRRFTSKAELVANTLSETSRALERLMLPERDPRALLITHTHNTIAFMSDERGRAVLNITESSSRIPELAEAVQKSVSSDQENFFDALRAVMPSATKEAVLLAFDLLVGTIMYRVAIGQRRLKRADVEGLVDAAISMMRARA